MSAGSADRPDANWRPTASLTALKRRASLKQLVRRFFHHRQVLEVDVPLMSAGANTDPAMQPVLVDDGSGRPRFLHTSPEFALKRLLAQFAEDVYFLGPVFRAGESGRQHNPEFHMLEWYRCGMDHRALAKETVALVREACQRPDWPCHWLSYAEAFQQAVALDPLHASDQAIAKTAADHGLSDADACSRRQCLDFLMATVVAEQFDRNALTVLLDFPADQAALARLLPGDPPLAARFELYAGTLELANGYHELCDALELEQRIDAEQQQLAERGLRARPADQRWLAAQRHGLPDCAGVALGFDRLVMLAEGTLHIHDILAFPAERA